LSPFTPNKPGVPDDLTEARINHRRVVGSVGFICSFYPEIPRGIHPDWEAAEQRRYAMEAEVGASATQ